MREENLPVGTILSLWKLPSGWSNDWISCDGQTINAGPFINQKASNLNNGRRFLQGGTPDAAGTYQDQDTNMSKLGGSYQDKFFIEGAGDDNIGCDGEEGEIFRWTDEYALHHSHKNAHCKVTRNVAFSGQAGETRPANMAVMYYMKIQ